MIKSPSKFAIVLALGCLALPASSRATLAAEREKVWLVSSLDGSRQPSYVIRPKGFDPAGAKLPLLVGLHTWSNDLEQRNEALEQQAAARGWLYLWPNFRGANKRPQACGSKLAQQDILDAVEWICQRFPVDRCRIYLTGVSGGGYMTMLMAARHPRVWAAASAWAGISDLAAWHELHRQDRYGKMLRACCGGAPGTSEEIDAEYLRRSPLTFLRRGCDVPLDIAHGVHDGHSGSVPVRHALQAFNALAAAKHAGLIRETEIAQLSRDDGRLKQPRPGDEGFDRSFARRYYLRRTAGDCRITIFEGGHEGIARAAVAWLAQHQRKPTKETPCDAAPSNP